MLLTSVKLCENNNLDCDMGLGFVFFYPNFGLFSKDKSICLVLILLLSVEFVVRLHPLTLFPPFLYEGRAYIGTNEDHGWQESFP